MQKWEKNKIFKNYYYYYFFKYPAEIKNPIKKLKKKKNSFLKFFHEFNAEYKLKNMYVQGMLKMVSKTVGIGLIFKSECKIC
jgi:hypothetical protein